MLHQQIVLGNVPNRSQSEPPQRRHYYYPKLPPRTFGRGDHKNIENWLEDNPRHTREDFYWLRQNQDQLPPYNSPVQDTENNNGEEQFQDAA